MSRQFGDEIPTYGEAEHDPSDGLKQQQLAHSNKVKPLPALLMDQYAHHVDTEHQADEQHGHEQHEPHPGEHIKWEIMYRHKNGIKHVDDFEADPRIFIILSQGFNTRYNPHCNNQYSWNNRHPHNRHLLWVQSHEFRPLTMMFFSIYQYI